uniref:Foldase protein prsA 2 n=1 Tax=Lygus hesperus TaxID=30085 RepID=A0A0A9WCW2_LYGHE
MYDPSMQKSQHDTQNKLDCNDPVHNKTVRLHDLVTPSHSSRTNVAVRSFSLNSALLTENKKATVASSGSSGSANNSCGPNYKVSLHVAEHMQRMSCDTPSTANLQSITTNTSTSPCNGTHGDGVSRWVGYDMAGKQLHNAEAK